MWLGKPSEYLPIYKALVHLPTTSRCLLWPHDPPTNHTIRNQAIRIHHTGVFKAERSHTRLSKRPAGVAQGVLYLRRNTLCQRILAKGDRRPTADASYG